MAVDGKDAQDFWYDAPIRGLIEHREVSDEAFKLVETYHDFRREMIRVTTGFENLAKHVNAEVVRIEQDLPNISSAETAGLIRRLARNIVQNCGGR